MGYETVVYQKSEGIGIITLNRPQVRNAISYKMGTELISILDDIERDADVWVIIITGGEECFCVGADIKEENRPPDYLEKLNLGLFNRLEAFPKPVIAAMAGYVLGGGCELSLCCDLRVAAENASIGVPEAKIGAIPAGGGTWRLPKMIGETRAKELLFVADPINAAEAHRIGLVNRVVPNGTVVSSATELAKILLDRPPISLKADKDCVRVGWLLDSATNVAYVTKWADVLHFSEDAQEGRLAFREKRKPVWKGK